LETTVQESGKKKKAQRKRALATRKKNVETKDGGRGQAGKDNQGRRLTPPMRPTKNGVTS